LINELNAQVWNVGIIFNIPKGIERKSFAFGFEQGLKTLRLMKISNIEIQNSEEGKYIEHTTGKFKQGTPLISIDNHYNDGKNSEFVVHLDSIPLTDIRCPCSDPLCYILKWLRS